MNDTKKLLEVRDLHKAYSKEGVPTKALNGITFDVLNGEYLGIMGARTLRSEPSSRRVWGRRPGQLNCIFINKMRG